MARRNPTPQQGVASDVSTWDFARRVWSIANWTLTILLFGWGAWLRFRLPLDPTVNPDTWGYLSPAVDALTGNGFTHHLRNYSYALFCFPILKAFGDFRAITVVQHLLGLAAGGMFLLAWMRLRSFSPGRSLPREIHQAVGLFGAAIDLFALEPIQFETALRADAITSVVAILNVWLALEFSYRCFIRRPEKIPAFLGLASVIAAIALALVKPSLALAACIALIPVFCSLFGRFSRRSKFQLIGYSAIAALILILPARIPALHDPSNRTFLPTQLFVIHANIIRDQLASDIAAGAPGPYSSEQLRAIEQVMSEEIVKASADRTYPVLGFNPDYLMFDRGSLDARIRNDFLPDDEQRCDFYSFYYRRAWLRQPGRMLSKIGEQLGIFYSRACPAYSQQKRRMLSDEYGESLSVIERHQLAQGWNAYPPFGRLVEQTKRLADYALAVEVSHSVRRAQLFLAHSYLAATALALCASIFIATRPRLRRDLGGSAAVVAFLSCYNLASCLEVAIVHSLENTRYGSIQLIYTLLAELAAWVLIARVVVELLRARADNGG